VRRAATAVPSGQFDLGAADPAVDADPAADADLEAPTLSGDDDDVPTGARELPRSHETRRVEAPLDDEDDPPTPQEIIDAPASLPPTAAAATAQLPRQARPTPLGVRARHPNAPRPVNTQTPTVPMPPAQAPAQPNAPQATLEEADTRQRTRKAPARTPPPPTKPSFTDDQPEPTVAARPQAQAQAATQAQQQQQSHRPPSQKVQPLPAPMPQASSAAATLTLSPSANPLGPTNKPSMRQSFEEPTRIPPAQPPPLDSGRFIPGLDDGNGDALPFGSPLSEPDAQLRPRGNRGVYVALGILGLVAIGAVAAVTLAGPGDQRGTLSIVSLPPGADVRIDGVSGTQQTPLTMPDVDPRASHHVRVSKGGYDVWESDVKFPPGERELRMQMVLVPTVGTVEIASTPPGAEAIVNGRIRGMTPATVGDLPPNDDVVIELRLRGYKVAHKTVSWAGKRLLQVSIPLEKAK
jgi:hypothetical protein